MDLEAESIVRIDMAMSSNITDSCKKLLETQKEIEATEQALKKLKDVGGQNPIEAAKMGCKVYHGPYVYNFNEIYELLAENKVSNKITSSEAVSYTHLTLPTKA